MNIKDYSWRNTSGDLSVLAGNDSDLCQWAERLLWLTGRNEHEWVDSKIRVPLSEVIRQVAERGQVRKSHVKIVAAPSYGNCEGIVCRVFVIGGDHCAEVLAIKMFCGMAKAYAVAQEIAMTLERIAFYNESPALMQWMRDLDISHQHHNRKQVGELVIQRAADALVLAYGDRQVTVAAGESVSWIAPHTEHDVALLAAALKTTWRYAEVSAQAAVAA